MKIWLFFPQILIDREIKKTALKKTKLFPPYRSWGNNKKKALKSKTWYFPPNY
jgi:hypothetical protein